MGGNNMDFVFEQGKNVIQSRGVEMGFLDRKDCDLQFIHSTHHSGPFLNATQGT